MKTEKELYEAILTITMKIKIQYPELSMYIREMPTKVPNVEKPKMKRELLQEYYDSLCVLLKEFLDYQSKISKLV